MHIFLLILISVFTVSGIETVDVPISGREFTITYNPSVKGILSGSKPISCVYAFDYWGTKGTYSGGESGLYQNVLEPDSGRAHEIKMTQKDDQWIAKIKIPGTAAILSYYFTDGETMEDNDFKTYVRYIYDQDMKPVRSARFRNIDFMVMAGKSEEEQISELQKEVADYPDYFKAYVPLWRMRFKSAMDFEDLLRLQAEFENQFTELKNTFGESDSLLLAEVSVYYNLSPNMYRLYRVEADEISAIMIPKIEKIPEEKRSVWIQQYYQTVKMISRGNEIISKIKGTLAPDFSFTTTENKKQMLSDYRGKIVLLDFWGMWCGPCVAEIPNLAKVYDRYHSNGFEIISISSDKKSAQFNMDEFKKFVEDKGMQWTQIVDDEKLPIHEKYGVIKWPSLFLIDKKGIVTAVDEGLRGMELSSTISAALE